MSRTFLRSMMSITLVSTGILFLLFISKDYINFLHESETTRTAFVESQKQLLQHEVTAAAAYIDGRIRQTDATIRKTIKERVEEAHAVASHIQRQNGVSKTPDEIQRMIKEALRNLRFNNGRGYYFIFNLTGIAQLLADRPELEGQNMLVTQGANGEFVVQDMMGLIHEKGEGFYEYTWTKPKEQNNFFAKIAYVKLFAPYDWVIGTGEYVDDVTADIQQEVLDKITGLKFGSEGYFFGSIEGGFPLFTNGKITKGTDNIWELTDPNGIKITQEYHDVIEKSGSGFLQYSWHKNNSSVLSPKISYVVGIPQWRWIIGAGVYLDTIEQEIAGKKELLLKKFIYNLGTLLIFLVVFMMLIYLWAGSIAGSIKKSMASFAHFFTQAASEFTTIDTDRLEYQEFKDIAQSANTMLAARQQAEENKAAEMSGQRLTYLGLAGEQYTFLDLSETCRRILPLLQAAAPEDVLIQKELPTTGPHIEGDANQIQQVLAALINNAGEAVAQNNGSVLLRILTVMAADIPVKQRFPIDWQPQSPTYACIEVQDTGCGITDEDREMLFDPFSSKKFIGRGLSLAIVLGIAKAHGGAVTVESKFARGSTFRLFLPLAEDAVLPEPKETSVISCP